MKTQQSTPGTQQASAVKTTGARQAIINRYQQEVDKNSADWLEEEYIAEATARINKIKRFQCVNDYPYIYNGVIEDITADYKEEHNAFWKGWQFWKANWEKKYGSMPNAITDKPGYEDWVASLDDTERMLYKRAKRCFGWRPLDTEAHRRLKARVRKLTIQRNKEIREAEEPIRFEAKAADAIQPFNAKRLWFDLGWETDTSMKHFAVRVEDDRGYYRLEKEGVYQHSNQVRYSHHFEYNKRGNVFWAGFWICSPGVYDRPVKYTFTLADAGEITTREIIWDWNKMQQV